MSVHSAHAGRGCIDDKPAHDKAFDYKPVGVTARGVPPIPDATGQVRCVDQQGPLFELVPRPCSNACIAGFGSVASFFRWVSGDRTALPRLPMLRGLPRGHHLDRKNV